MPNQHGTGHEISLPVPVRFSVGMTGHNEDNVSFSRNRQAIEQSLASIYDCIDASIDACGECTAIEVRPTRLHSLLSAGADSVAVELALKRGWRIIAPLPFGLDLNIAINARPNSGEQARKLCAGLHEGDDAVARRARQIHQYASAAQLLELSEQDDLVAEAFFAALDHPDNPAIAGRFGSLISDRVTTSGRIMIEQSDLLIGIWDGVTRGKPGGTFFTLRTALEKGCPVLWLDASNPGHWSILRTPEALNDPLLAKQDATAAAQLDQLVREALLPPGWTGQSDARTSLEEHLEAERWRPKSRVFFHAYRKFERLFGNGSIGTRLGSVRQTFADPGADFDGDIAGLSNAVRRYSGASGQFLDRIEQQVLRRFIWADGIATYLSDAYRGGMVLNFLLGAAAVICGVAYLPIVPVEQKWVFALGEFLLLIAIVAITSTGQRRQWHSRWFRMRRVAEYLRHAPLLLVLGVARNPAQWPRTAEPDKATSSWPEWYVRHSLRGVGLPQICIDKARLTAIASDVLAGHCASQKHYHLGKAAHLKAVHHNLDHISETMFKLAIVSVLIFLLLQIGSTLGMVDDAIFKSSAKIFTFLGVALPSLGGAFAGIKFFGDFERFGQISEATAQQLETVELRINQVLQAAAADPASAIINFHVIADLAHAVDDIVVREIESWQSVFVGKQITVPV